MLLSPLTGRLYSEDKASRKKKQYILTQEGLSALQQEVRRLDELVENGRHMLAVGSVELEVPGDIGSLQMT